MMERILPAVMERDHPVGGSVFTSRVSCKPFLGYVGFPLKGCDSARLKQHTVYRWLHIVLAKQVVRLFQCHVWFPGAKLVPFLVQVPQCEK